MQKIAHQDLEHSFTSGIKSYVDAIKLNLSERRMFKKTLKELQALSDRELNDLGISRSDIGAIAHEAVYGK